MTSDRPLDPPLWSDPVLEDNRQKALTAFVAERGSEGTQEYEALFARTRLVIERLFDASNDLLSFDGSLFQREPKLLDAARYLGGPPVSADDLKTLLGAGTSKRNLADDDLARRLAVVLQAAWDPIRFPWLQRGRRPNRVERTTAILWTTGIWAIEQLRTRRRGESSRRQEESVARLLITAGFKEITARRVIRNQDDLNRGEFVRRANLGGDRGSNADLAIRLHDGRLLALECKVSNSAVNSIKRLIHETGHKSSAWNDLFGSRVICGAVLGGVYKLGNLLDAQNNYRVTIFWEHELAPLDQFLKDAR